MNDPFHWLKMFAIWMLNFQFSSFDFYRSFCLYCLSRCVYDTSTEERRTLPARHHGAVQCLALIDVLHHQTYHTGLQHHAMVSGGDREAAPTQLLDS